MNVSTVAGRAFAILDKTVLRHAPPELRTKAYGLAYRAKQAIVGGGYGGANRDLPTSPGIPRKGTKTLPPYIQGEIDAIRLDVDPGFLLSGPPKANRHQTLFPTNPAPGAAYRAIVDAMEPALDEVTHVILVPWLKRGGADLVAVAHATDLARRQGVKASVISTLEADSPWASRLPNGVGFVEFGKAARHLSPHDRRTVLARLLVQSSARTIHVVNSALGWEILGRHGQALGQTKSLFASLYCDDGITPDGRRKGFAHEFLPAAARHLSGIVLDNTAYAAVVSGLYGFPRERMHVAWVPTQPAELARRGDRVLWAGRLDDQKRIGLLAAIAEAAPDLRFDVHGSPLLGSDPAAIGRLGGLENVSMHGAYDRFGAIDLSSTGAYLHTSAWDGLPNVLLEAGARGLPVVAPDVGGIGDLVTPTTGWLVRSTDDPMAYVQALREALASDGTKPAEIRRLVRERHSDESFARVVSGIPGYVG